MRKILRVVGFTILFCAATLAMGEVLLRAYQRVAVDPRGVAAERYIRMTVGRIHSLWFRPRAEQTDPFIPPFRVFSDANIGDTERLARIAEATRLPPSSVWTSYDFLQDPARASTTVYTVHSNALGFRGERDYPADKPAGTKRIIVLGSYHAFGHGVNDEDTYAAQLESLLNASSTGERYEVWNGGAHAGTAIVGLSRFDEALSYEPDAIILDYGFIDTLVYGDDVFPVALRFPDEKLSAVARAAAQPIIYAFDHSVLLGRAFDRVFRNKGRERGMADFQSAMNAMIDRASAAGVPVILVRQLNTPPPAFYESLMRPGMAFLDVDATFASTTIEYLPAEEWHSGYWARTWLSELDPAVAAYVPQAFRYHPLRLNFYQLNSLGQGVVAESLVPLVQAALQRQ